jgi:Cdc6-like AAA superfamily ATPase
LAPDPSTNYHKAHKQRQAETGLWLLESAKFAKWKDSAASRLWLYGIPGCGKTILSSTIIEHLVQHCHDDTTVVTAYFYFDFSDTQKQDPELMLRSLLCQSLQRSVVIPKGVDALFSACENGHRQPSLHALLELKPQAMQQFTHAYIVLDALDECTQRQELMDVLETVAAWQLGNVHLLMTSRR